MTNYNQITELNGRLFKLKTDNSKQLFIPTTGYGEDGLIYIVETAQEGYLWSSSLYDDEPCSGFSLYSNLNYVYGNSDELRHHGYPILGILDTNK